MVSQGVTLENRRRPRGRCRRIRRWPAIVALAIATGLMFVPAAAAQPAAPPSTRHAGVVIEASAPVMNLFGRAQEGIDRRDWKFAIDSLQRIIDDPQWSLLPREQPDAGGYQLYESARRRALRQLAALPPAGLAAYRVLHDGEAKGMLQRARDAHDTALLRSVTDRLLLTHYGDDAADLLASWLLDAGRYGEVISVLTDLRELVPDSDVPPERVYAKLCAAQEALGQEASAESLLARYESETGSPPPDWFSALTRPAAPSASATEEHVAEGLDWSWPMRGGTVRRQGVMPPISPTVTDTVPWQHALSVRPGDVWDRVRRTERGNGLELPVPNYAASNDRLVVRDSFGVQAFNLEDLSPLWNFVDDAVVGSISAGGAPQQTVEPNVDDAYEDYVSAAVSIADGLALFVQNAGLGLDWVTDEKGVSKQTTSRVTSLRNRVPRGDSSRLIAVNVATGLLAWERGRSFHADDPLGAVSMRGVPVPVGDDLWMPVIENRDLSIAVLDPADGKLVGKVALCGLPEGGPLPGVSMDLAVANGLVYVPTEFGVLFAVKADDRSIQWAVRYGDGPLLPSGSQGTPRRITVRGTRVIATPQTVPGAWESTPPIVVGGVVLVSPTDGRELMAFSSAFGDLLWSADFDDTDYVIAADDQHVWLGGTSIVEVSLRDGSQIWSQPLEETASARAVLAGGNIQVPTVAGLITLDASTGAVTNRQLLTDPPAPLGNLLCTDAAMFSIEPSSVRKYPDTGRPFVAATEAYQANPKDSAAALRLAWLQYLRGAPQAALDTLSTLGALKNLDDVRRANAVSHLRVEALLSLAKSDASDAGLNLLRRAQAEALDPPDQLRTCLAVADHLVKSNRQLDAFSSLLETALEPSSAKTLSLGDRVTASARLRIAGRLVGIRQTLSDDALAPLLKSVAAKVDGAIRELAGRSSDAAVQYLEAVADLPLPASMRTRALVALGDRARSTRAYERSELFLHRAMEQADAPALQLAVLMRLANLGLEPTQQVSSIEAARLDRLQSEFANVPMPPESDIAPFRDGAATVLEWVAAARAKLGSAPSATGGGAVTVTQAIRLGGPVAWQVLMPRLGRRTETVVPFTPIPVVMAQVFAISGNNGPRLVTMAGTFDALGSDRAIFHAMGDVVYCQRTTDGALLWQTTLQAPESFDRLSGTRLPPDSSGRRRAVIDGQVAVFNGQHGLFGVGVLTGRRLWYKPYEYLPRPDETQDRDSLMDADDGMLAAMLSDGRLSMLRTLDGAELWQRDLRVGDIASIRMTADAVVALDRTGRRAQLVDRETGALIQRIAFDQPTQESGLVDVVQTGSLLIGPDAGDGELSDPGIAAYDTKTGRQAWRMGFLKPVAQIFDAGLGYLGAGLLGGDVVVMEVDTGEVAFTHRVEGVSAVTGGRVIATDLVVQAASPADQRRLPMLVGLDIVTGQEDWRFENLARPAEFDKVTANDELPVIVEQPNRRELGAALVDLRTGDRLGDVADVASNRMEGHNFNSDYGLFDGVLMVGYSDGVQAFSTEPHTSEQKEGL